MSDLNGRQTLDLSDLIETLHVKAGEVEFDMPKDVSVPLLGEMRKIGERLNEVETLNDEQLVSLDDDLWVMADRLLARATPALAPARDILTLPALMKLIEGLTGDFPSTAASTTSSPSPGSTEAPSPSETSLEALPSTVQPSE